MASMRAYDAEHSDPRPLARSAAVRSVREQDPAVRMAAREMSMAERLAAGFELSRLASRVRPPRR